MVSDSSAISVVTQLQAHRYTPPNPDLHAKSAPGRRVWSIQPVRESSMGTVRVQVVSSPNAT